MSNVIKIEKQLVQNKLKEVNVLLKEISRSLNLVEGNLDVPAFKVNLVNLVSKLLKEEVQPTIQKINNVRDKLVSLRRFNINQKALEELISSVDTLYFGAAVVKHGLEKVTVRSNAYLLVEIAVQKKIVPALKDLLEVWDNYEAVLKSVNGM